MWLDGSIYYLLLGLTMARDAGSKRTVQAIVSPQTWDKLVAVAERRDVSVSRVVRGLIEGLVNRKAA